MSQANHALAEVQQETVTLDEEATQIKNKQVEETQEQADAGIQAELIQGLLTEEQVVAKEQ